MHSFHFTHVHSYRSDDITVSVELISSGGIVPVLATIDTGASDCLFQREQAEWLNLDIESGEPRVFRTGAGPLQTFGHVVQIAAFDMLFESMVYFFADPGVRKNLLGRNGFLDRIRLGLVHYDRELYLAPYNR